MVRRAILSTTLLIGEGAFRADVVDLETAKAWLDQGPFVNYCGHETVRILGLEPARGREFCTGYDEALALKPKARLESGREYSLAEIEEVGIEFTLIRAVPDLSQVLDLAARLPTGLDDAMAASKLLQERDELMASLLGEDYVGALTEGADAAYYAAKHLDWVARRLDLSLDDLVRLAIAKYSLRARPGNPKDPAAERAACERIVRVRRTTNDGQGDYEHED